MFNVAPGHASNPSKLGLGRMGHPSYTVTKVACNMHDSRLSWRPSFISCRVFRDDLYWVDDTYVQIVPVSLTVEDHPWKPWKRAARYMWRRRDLANIPDGRPDLTIDGDPICSRDFPTATRWTSRRNSSQAFSPQITASKPLNLPGEC